MGKKDNVLTIFIANYFETIENIFGGYGERVFGLYGSYSNNFSSKDHTVLIFTQRNNTLLTYTNSTIQKIKENVSPLFLIKFIGERKKSFQKVRIIASWPDISLFGVIIIFICKYMYNCKIILDVHDLRTEQLMAFSEKRKNLFLMNFHRIFTFFIFKLVDLLIITSVNFLNYVAIEYKINKNKMILIENGTFPEYIFPLEKPSRNNRFTLAYCGSAAAGKGLIPLINIVERLKQKIPIVFNIYGGNVLGLIPNDTLHIKAVPFSQINTVLNQADVLIIPYPKKLYFDITHPIKLSDYMASGKPIICLDIQTTGDIIRKFNCGIVCENYQQFEEALLYLYTNKDEIPVIGAHGRVAAITYFDWKNLAQKLYDLTCDI